MMNLKLILWQIRNPAELSEIRKNIHSEIHYETHSEIPNEKQKTTPGNGHPLVLILVQSPFLSFSGDVHHISTEAG